MTFLELAKKRFSVRKFTDQLYMAFQKGTQTALHGGTVPPQAGM